MNKKIAEINEILEADQDILDATYIALTRMHTKTSLVDYKRNIAMMLPGTTDMDIIKTIYELLLLSE